MTLVLLPNIGRILLPIKATPAPHGKESTLPLPVLLQKGRKHCLQFSMCMLGDEVSCLVGGAPSSPAQLLTGRASSKRTLSSRGKCLLQNVNMPQTRKKKTVALSLDQ